MRDLLPAQTDLVHATAWITDGKNGNRVSPAAFALLATGPVTDGAIQKRPAQDIAGFGKPRNKPVAFANELFQIH
jgi:hypothetical protein